MEPLKAHLPRTRSEAANSFSESNLGEAVSVLYRIHGDPDYPFSEVTGLLQRIDRPPGAPPTYSVIRRTGEVVEFSEASVVKAKLLPPASGRIRLPKAWKTDQS